ncbi:hypothetical protein [Saccharothrix stipae]
MPIVEAMLIHPATILDRFHRQPTNFGVATHLLTNLDDDPARIHDLLPNLLTGTTEQRQRATHLALRLDPATATGILIPLIGDPAPAVRADAAAALADLVANGATTPLTLTMLKHSLADPGTLVARTVALVLADVAPTDNTRTLLNDLEDHSSAIVRHTVSAAIGCKSDYDHASSLARSRDARIWSKSKTDLHQGYPEISRSWPARVMNEAFTSHRRWAVAPSGQWAKVVAMLDLCGTVAVSGMG